MVTGKKAEQNTSWPVHTPLRDLHSCRTFEERQRDGGRELSEMKLHPQAHCFSGTDIKNPNPWFPPTWQTSLSDSQQMAASLHSWKTKWLALVT